MEKPFVALTNDRKLNQKNQAGLRMPGLNKPLRLIVSLPTTAWIWAVAGEPASTVVEPGASGTIVGSVARVSAQPAEPALALLSTGALLLAVAEDSAVPDFAAR